jgi:hypothetical protein
MGSGTTATRNGSTPYNACAIAAEYRLGTITRSAAATFMRSHRAWIRSSTRTSPRSFCSSSAMIPLSATT